MRQPFKVNYFDAVFNLFTSIGYFKDFNDNYAVFKNVELALKKDGVFVIDFFNSNKVTTSFKNEYLEQRGDIAFHIKKKVIHNVIIKRIEFSDNGKSYYFEEYVSLLDRTDFEDFAKEAGLVLEKCFGNYHLEPFDEKNSERLILIFKK